MIKEKYRAYEDYMNQAEALLQCIANELAEANRLKRLELVKSLLDSADLSRMVGKID